jgi:signal transduction histidine kinase
VKLLVDLHRGDVWAESAGLESGSTFIVELPAAIND